MPSAFDKKYTAFLFDMDGTLINSTAAAERVWARWAEEHGLDVKTFLPTMTAPVLSIPCAGWVCPGSIRSRKPSGSRTLKSWM